MLDWMEQTERPNLNQIETIILDLRHQFGKTLTENVIVVQVTVQLVGALDSASSGGG